MGALIAEREVSEAILAGVWRLAAMGRDVTSRVRPHRTAQLADGLTVISKGPGGRHARAGGLRGIFRGVHPGQGFIRYIPAEGPRKPIPSGQRTVEHCAAA